jgi:hypothetical protein
MEKKLTNSGPFMKSTSKHSIYPLKRIDATWVDGDSRYQIAIHAITTIEPCEPGNER